MIRVPLLICLCSLPVLGDAREEFFAAKKQLDDAYFDELDPDRRDRLFEALASLDDTQAIPALALIASRFGTYMAGLSAQLGTQQQKLTAYQGRTALSDQEVGLRNSYIRKVEKLEKLWRRAARSEGVLVKVLGGYRKPMTVEAALIQLATHPTGGVRTILARACASWHTLLLDVRLSKRMFAALKKLRTDKEVPVRVAAVRSMSAFRRSESFKLMVQSLNDPDWRVRTAAVKGMHEARTNEAVDALINRMRKEKGRLQDDINKVLKDITGQNHGYAESWAGWWNSVGKVIPKKRPANGLAAGSKKARDTASFYGIPTRSDRICFIIDVSGSMKKEVKQFKRVVITGRKNSEMPVEGKTRLEVAQNELKRAISNLNADKEFSIIFFNHAVKVWRPSMVKANRQAKSEARRDIEAQRASGATYTLGALRRAFQIAGVTVKAGGTKSGRNDAGIDTIFLLSDGGPTNNKIEEPKPMDPDLILEAVRGWNRDAGIVIHCIAVDTNPEGTYFLKSLAAQNGGEFVERRQ